MVISHHLPVSTLTIRDLHLTRKIWKSIAAKAAQVSTFVSTHWATHVTTIHTAKSPFTSLAILWPVSASLHRPLPRRKHWNTWDRTVALSPPSPWLRTWAILWPAGDQPLSLIQNYSNISKYVSTCLNNLQKQYFFFILLCPLADVSSGLTSDGKSADWDNSCRTKQDVPQKTSTANTCIQLHFCLVLAKMLGRVWPCFVFGLVGFGGLCTFLPCFLTPHGRSSGDFAFGSGSRRFPACHSGRPEPNQLRSSPLESYMGNLMFSSIVYSNIF